MRTRPAIAQLRPYQPGRPAADVRRELGLERVVKLASNEGPFGPFPAALDAIARAAVDLNRYPELGWELRERLAQRHGVAAERILVGNGADAVVGYLSSTYLDPGDEALMGWPSFISYRLDAIRMGATPVAVDLSDGSYDLPALLDRIGPRTRLVYVCNPNNPTGGMVGHADLAAFLDAVPEDVLVVVDEAYHEYVVDPDYPDAIIEHGDRPNVAVLRTFSKIYGLAGLRVGYMVASSEVVSAAGRVRRAFDVSDLAHAAALASMDDPAEVSRRREANSVGRGLLETGLRRLGAEPLPACANFVCLEVGDARGVATRLEHQGVIVRPLGGFGAPTSIRVTVGTPEEIALFLSAFASVLETA
ncbi:MAG: histidinol-phosphate transaminase [Gaiellales bacterium]